MKLKTASNNLWPAAMAVLGMIATASSPASVTQLPQFTNAAEKARAVPFEETVFGIKISDPYRWMEDPSSKSEMVEWVRSSSAAGMAQIGKLPGRAKLREELMAATRAGVSYSGVHEAGGLLFSMRLDVDASVPKLVVRAADGAERVLFDPVATPGTPPVAIDSFSPSPRGTLVAIHTAAGGGEVGPIRFMDVARGTWRDDVIEPVWGEFQAGWMDEQTVLFTRLHPSPGGDLLQNMQAGMHRMGRRASQDNVVLAADGPQKAIVRPSELPVLATYANSDWSVGALTGARADARVMVARNTDLTSGRATWREVATYDDNVTSLGMLDDGLYAIVTKNAPNGEVRRIDAVKGTAADATVILPASDAVLSDIYTVKEGIYVVTLNDGINGLIFLPGGKGPAKPVAVEPGTIYGVAPTGDGQRITFGVTTWTRRLRFFVAAGGVARETGVASASYAPSENIAAQTIDAVSADGTHVPLTLLSLKGTSTTGAAPTLLEAYGSYGIPTRPSYSFPRIAWVGRGGIYAACGVRGGGDKGRVWHEAGRGPNKPNAQADLVACAEKLIQLNYTRPDHLAITGTSAGGLVVPPAALKRPDLFRVVLSRVGAVNPTRLATAQNGPNQYAEMGDPTTEAGFKALATADAYLMLDGAKDTPDWFITVGLNDHRVEPWMNAKFAAKALAKFGDKRRIFIRADPEAGHGVGSTRDQTVEEWADALSFLLNRFGDPEFQLPAAN
jgi:prolyl oligopeptidase